MTISWVNSALFSSNTVSYGTSVARMTSSATGTAFSYTQLLAASSNLVKPSMGAPGATASEIISISNTSSFAYDHISGKKWSNYKNVKTFVPGQLASNNPYAYYDSPVIHTTILSDLIAGETYYYQPAEACKVYNFTMTPAVATYPFKAGLVADLGTTDVSAKSIAVLAAMNSDVVIFAGDLCFGKQIALYTSGYLSYFSTHRGDIMII